MVVILTAGGRRGGGGGGGGQGGGRYVVGKGSKINERENQHICLYSIYPNSSG